MSSLPREKGYYKERALRRLGELIPRETEAPKEIAENPVGPSREEPDEEPSPKSALHDAAPAAQIDLPPGLEPPGAFGGGTVGVGMDRDPASNDEQEPKILFSLDQSSSSDEDEEEAQMWAPQLWMSPPDSERLTGHQPNDNAASGSRAVFGREMKHGDTSCSPRVASPRFHRHPLRPRRRVADPPCCAGRRRCAHLPRRLLLRAPSSCVATLIRSTRARTPRTTSPASPATAPHEGARPSAPRDAHAATKTAARKSRDGREARSQNMLGKFNRLFPGRLPRLA